MQDALLSLRIDVHGYPLEWVEEYCRNFKDKVTQSLIAESVVSAAENIGIKLYQDTKIIVESITDWDSRLPKKVFTVVPGLIMVSLQPDSSWNMFVTMTKINTTLAPLLPGRFIAFAIH